MNINELAKQIYDANCKVGWWDNPNPCVVEKMQLASTEVAEATEGERKSLMDDHLPHRKMGEVELADTLIRILDFGAYLKLRYTGPTHVWDRDIANWSIGRQHFYINRCLVYFHDDPSNQHYSNLIDCVLKVALNLGYDIESAATEKLAYNAKRADHKREARAAENGKKF